MDTKTMYTELNRDSVFDNLELGNKIIMCDFPTMAMVDCAQLKVSQLQYYITKEGVKFFREIVTVNEIEQT